VFNEAEPLDEESMGAPGTYPKLNWLKGGILSADKVRALGAAARALGGSGSCTCWF
jgi:hypothetical protein